MTIDQKAVPYPTSRQARLYTFLVSLYRPAPLTSLASLSDPGDRQAADGAYEAQPAYTNVHAYYMPTPEYGRVEDIGLTKEDSVLVSDVWRFFDTQEVADGWLIVMTGCKANNSLIGRAWVVQGNSTLINSSPRRPDHAQWVYAKLSPTDTIPSQ